MTTSPASVAAMTPTHITPTHRQASTLGPWELTSLIASQALTEIFAARPIGADDRPSDYVVKRVRPECRDDATVQTLLRQEVECGESVSHENLVPILASDLASSPQYLVMPRIGGVTIRSVLDQAKTFSPPQSLWTVRQIADGVAVLHASNWVHGDIKPSNVIAAENGHATLIDFGFAARFHDEYPSSICTLQSTLAYTAPELLTSRGSLGPGSDVYSLGILLYELLTGRLPFPYGNKARLAEAHLHEPPVSIRSVAPQLPRSLARLVNRMLAKHPARRPSSSGELQDELAQLEIETFGMRFCQSDRR